MNFPTPPTNRGGRQTEAMRSPDEKQKRHQEPNQEDPNKPTYYKRSTDETAGHPSYRVPAGGHDAGHGCGVSKQSATTDGREQGRKTHVRPERDRRRRREQRARWKDRPRGEGGREGGGDEALLLARRNRGCVMGRDAETRRGGAALRRRRVGLEGGEGGAARLLFLG